jgi:hypothetical protein
MALSVRQPWAIALVRGAKRLENRDWQPTNPGLKFRGPVCIHASAGLTRQYYLDAAEFMARLGFAAPDPAQLERGGIIGVATITGVLREAADPWFFGPLALTIADARPVKFVPCKGALGFFRWREAPAGYQVDVPKWMRKDAA